MYEMQSAAGRGDTGEGKSDKSLYTPSPEHTSRHLRTSLPGAIYMTTPHHPLPTYTPRVCQPTQQHTATSPHSPNTPGQHPCTPRAAPTCPLHVTHPPSTHTILYSLTLVLTLVITVSHSPSPQSFPGLRDLHLTVRSEGWRS